MSETSGKPWPRIAVVGAGAVGGYFGSMLARAGAPVTIIGRETFVEAVKTGGLVIETAQGEMRTTIKASTNIADAADADVVLFCVKTNDTTSTAAALARVLKPKAQVVSLQNGVDNVERIRGASGVSAIATVVYVAVSVVQPGRIRHLARGDLVVAPDARDVAALFTRAKVPCVVSDDIETELWTKLSTNCALNALSALARAPYGRIVENPEAHELITGIVDEVYAVARSAGIGSKHFTRETLQTVAFKLAQQMPTTMSSTAQDLSRGKQTEIDSLNGYISRRGAELGVATPLNSALCGLIKLSEENN